MKTYNIVKTINGQYTGTIINNMGAFDSIEEAREGLVSYMTSLDHGGDDRFIADGEAKQNEIEMLNSIAEEEGTDVSAEIEKVKSWNPPCLIYQPDFEEICNAAGDSFCYDNYRVEIVEA